MTRAVAIESSTIPPAIGKRRVLVGPPYQNADDDQPAETDVVQGPPHLRRVVPPAAADWATPWRGRHRSTGRRPGCRCRRRPGSDRSPGGTAPPWRGPTPPPAPAWPAPAAGARARPVRSGTDAAQSEPEQPGPDQVELLLHRQGPQMSEGRRRTEPGEVRDVLEDQPPVAHVERRRHHVPARGSAAPIRWAMRPR